MTIQYSVLSILNVFDLIQNHNYGVLGTGDHDESIWLLNIFVLVQNRFLGMNIAFLKFCI